jgi:hypothetical protein
VPCLTLGIGLALYEYESECNDMGTDDAALPVGIAWTVALYVAVFALLPSGMKITTEDTEPRSIIIAQRPIECIASTRRPFARHLLWGDA